MNWLPYPQTRPVPMGVHAPTPCAWVATHWGEVQFATYSEGAWHTEYGAEYTEDEVELYMVIMRPPAPTRIEPERPE